MRKTLAAVLLAVMMGSPALTGYQDNARPTSTGAPKEMAVKTEESKTEDTTAAVGWQVTITISNRPEAEDAISAILKGLLDDSTIANPSIRVESQVIPSSQYKDQVLVAGASGNAADVIMGNFQMTSVFSGAGILAGLDTPAPKKVSDDIYPGYLSGTTCDGKVKALSWASHPIAMYHNKELFTKAGLGLEKASVTWDEMIETVKVIATLGKDDVGNALYGLGILTDKVAHIGIVFDGIFYTYDGYLVDDASTVDLNNAGNVEVFVWTKQLVDEKVIPGDLETKNPRGLFASDQISIVFDGDMGCDALRSSSGLNEELDKKVGVAIIPAGKTGRSETVCTEH